ncbi:MAG: YceI family protein [Balneolaceae bacterium]
MNLPRKWTMLLIVVSLLLPGGGGDLIAQVLYQPDDESRLWIEGRSNINQFRCDAQEYDGQARLPEENSEQISPGSPPQQEAPSLRVEIPVHSFECGRSRMNRDLTDALKADRHPLITFELIKAVALEPEPGLQGSGEHYRLEVTGTLTVAGVSRNVTFRVNGTALNNGRYHATGNKTILMTDYDVTPPTGLLGLVRAENELTVHFDLYAVRR